MNGDGLLDIVRARNGEVCYWPNRGYGRFGAKVTMDNSPLFDTPDMFDPRRLRFADIDGCGNADMLYLKPEGQRYSTTRPVTVVPLRFSWPTSLSINDIEAIDTVDLLGNGLWHAWCVLAVAV